MIVRISRFPIHTQVKAGVTVVNRLAEASLVTNMPQGVEVDSFFDPQCARVDRTLELRFAWVEGSEDLFPAQVSECLREEGWICADATAGAALVRDFWLTLHYILEDKQGSKFALLGQVFMAENGVFYAEIHRGEGYTRVIGTRSVHDQFPSSLPVLVYQKG